MAMYIKVEAGEVYNDSNSLTTLITHARDARNFDGAQTEHGILLESYDHPWAMLYGARLSVVYDPGGAILTNIATDWRNNYTLFLHGFTGSAYDANKIDHFSAAKTSYGEWFHISEQDVAWKLSGEVGVGFNRSDFLTAAAAVLDGNTAPWLTYYNSQTWNFTGAEGNDVFYGGNMGDTIRGGLGQDALSGGGGGDFIYGEEDIDVLAGGDGNDRLFGGNGADMLLGGDEHDTLVGGAGADFLDGGEGQDTASYVDALAVVTARLDLPNLNKGDALGDRYFSIENLGGSIFADFLVGNANANSLNGNRGADTLHGQGGHDSLFGGDDADKLFGGTGDDIMNGGKGADALDGGANIDTASYRLSSSGVTASLENTAVNTGEAVGDSYVSIEELEGSAFGDILIGNALNNDILGLGGTDALYGKSGADGLYGGAGNDFLEGGAGADFLVGGADFDFAMYAFATAGVTANLANPTLNTGDALGDKYDSIEGLGGSSFADKLTGDAKGNVINGLLGKDILAGGAGADAFVFNTLLNSSTNVDVITDFSVVDDVMWLENDGLFSKLSTGALNAGNFRVGAAAADANDYLIYNNATGDLFYDADGNGAGAAVKFAHVNVGTALTTADFIFI